MSRGEGQPSPVTRFVVLFEGRAGSSHLISLLDSHPRIRAEPEVLKVLKDRGAGPKQQLEWARRALTNSGREFAAVGFKTKVRDVLDPGGLAALLVETGAKVIHMERENLVKLALSSINAQRLYKVTGRFNRLAGDPELPPMIVTPSQLERSIKQRRRWQQELLAYVTQLNLPTMRVTYEEFLAEQESVLSDVCHFLNVERNPLHSVTRKTTPDDLRSAIQNLDELKQHFVGTEYEPMFR